MRSIFGVLSLLIVVAIVGVLAKKQMSSIREIKVPATAGSAGPAPGVNLSVDPNATVQQQSQQIQRQFKAAAEAAVQQPRPMPDDK